MGRDGFIDLFPFRKTLKNVLSPASKPSTSEMLEGLEGIFTEGGGAGRLGHPVPKCARVFQGALLHLDAILPR